MKHRRPSWILALSVLCYLVGATLLTRFVEPNGLGLMLVAVPLYTVTRQYGRKAGFLAVAAALVLNSAVWVAAGNGVRTLSTGGVTYVVVLYLVECGGAALFVLLVDTLRRSEEARLREIERSVSERAAAEEKYRISESKYRNLVELAPEAISVVEAGKVSFCNSHFLEMLGYTREEMIGKSLEAITYKDDLLSAMERYQRRMQGTVLPKTVFRHVRKGGGVIWAETVGQRIEWEGRPAVMYFSSDITERRMLEEQFVQAQKMESVGRLAGGIAHDFNNILQVILGFCEILLTTETDREETARVVKTIKESAQRAAALTMQLLAFSRKQSVVLSPVNVDALARESRDMLAKMVGEDIVITYQSDGAEAVAAADAGQLQQVLMNLAVNARDAMPEGGRLDISVSRAAVGAADSGRPVEMSPGDYVLLQVRDTGVGMDGETLSRLFEPFFTTKDLGKGTGLGLSIVYGIVKQTKGHILVESRVGSGTTFKIYLPPATGAREPPEIHGVEAHRGTETVLLVEDEEAVRDLVHRQLADCGYRVLSAPDGVQALEVCRENAGRIDVLLTDVVLPGVRGGKVAEAFRASNPKGRVIYMTGYTDAAGFEEAARREGAAILQKPFTLNSLVAGIRRVPNGRAR